MKTTAGLTAPYLVFMCWFLSMRLDYHLDILPRLKPWDSWVLTPPHGYLSRLPRLTGAPQRGNALPQNVVRSMEVAVVMQPTNRTSPHPIMQR